MCIDCLCVFLYIVFIARLEDAQKEYVESFVSGVIQVQNFTVRVRNLPPNSNFGGDTSSLSAALMHHFQKEMARTDLEEEINDYNLHLLEDGDDSEKPDDGPPDFKLKDAMEFEIADINFGKRTQTDA